MTRNPAADRTSRARSDGRAALVAATLAATLGSITAAEAPLTVATVGAGELTPVDRRLFGHFLERPGFGGEWGPEAVCDDRGELPPAVVELMRELRIPLLRYPGGTAIDHQDWIDLIEGAPGRAPGRAITNVYKGDAMTNRFGLHEFMRLSADLGAETLLVVNLQDALEGRKTIEEAAAHAAAMVAYCNLPPGAETPLPFDWGALRAANGHPEPFGVRLVQVGNESWFYWPPRDEIRARLGLADGEQAVVDWHRRTLIAYADAIHGIDPTVELITDGLHDPWNHDNDAKNAPRRRVLLDPEIRSRYRYLTYHGYFPMSYAACLRAGAKVEPATVTNDELWYALAAGGPGLIGDDGQNHAWGRWNDELIAAGWRVAATEWNFNAWGFENRFPDRPFDERLPAALSTGALLNGFLRQTRDADLATQSMLVGTSWNITAIRCDPQGVEPPRFIPQALATRLYAHHHGDRLLPLRLDGVPYVPQPIQLTTWHPPAERLALLDIVATGDDRRVVLHVVNRARDADLPLRIVAGAAGVGDGTATWESVEGDPRPSREPLRSRTGEAQVAGGVLELVVPRHTLLAITLPRR